MVEVEEAEASTEAAVPADPVVEEDTRMTHL
jgi:hypothetical protein